MKFYRGRRLPGRARNVIVKAYDDNGRETDLPMRLDLRGHSPDGFEWGYGGSGPSQLALAILAHYLRDDARALRIYQSFKHDAIAQAQGEVLEISGAEIDRLVRKIEAEREGVAS